MTRAATGIRIVTDTTATVPSNYLQEHQIESVPQIILFGEQSLLENVEIGPEEFVRRLKESPRLPKTAAPLVGDMIEAYRRQLKHARTILSIHPSAEVSGTVRSANAAIQESFPHEDIRVIDTRTIGGPLASLVMAATEWAESGVEADEVVRRLEALIPRCRSYFLVATLEYLQKGGRIGGASALVGSMLQIKPLLQLKDGRVEVLEKIRTHNHAMERLMELVIAECPHSPEAHLTVMHSDNLEKAKLFAAGLESALGLKDVPIYNLGAAITTHGGPGMLAAGFFVE